jgi:hypothetical protein
MIRLKTVTVIGVVVIVCMAIGTFGWLSIHGIDTRQFLYFFATSIGPTIALLWNNHKTSQVSAKVDTIEENTNGLLTERMNDQTSTLTYRIDNPHPVDPKGEQ